MENDFATPSLYGAESERGAGGKYRKQPPRKPQSTPYARPPPPPGQSQSVHRRWLSKLVIDPAYRLISSSANRILPSFFSKAASDALALPAASSEENDNWQTEVEKDDSGDHHNWTSNHEISKATEAAGPSRAADGSRGQSDIVEVKQNKVCDISDDNRLSEIEQLMKGKKFSRDEIDRLMEIIHSRAVDLPNIDKGKEPANMNIIEAEGPVEAHEIARTSSEEKNEDLDRAIISTPLLQSHVQDDIAPSPIDIARAYMRNRTSEVGLHSKSIVPKGEKPSPLRHDESASKLFIPSPSPKPSVCWPGAMAQDHHGYLTPQSQRGRFGLHNFPRTPYSRTIHSQSRSKTRLQGDNSRYLDILSSPLQKSHTPIYGQVKSRSDALDDRYGSVGPIRRTKNKDVAEKPSRGSAYFHSVPTWPSQVEKPNVSKGFTPVALKNSEPGGGKGYTQFQTVDLKPNSEVGAPTVPSQSSQIAKTILEHLDRNPPTPKDKSLELKLATAWKKPVSSNVTTVKPNEQSSLLHLGVFDSHVTQVGQNSTQKNEDKGNFSFKDPLQEGANEITNAVNSHTSASTVNVSDVAIQSGNAGPSLNFRKTFTTPIPSRKEDVSKIVPNAGGSKLLNTQNKPPSSNKPNLSSIFINKPDAGSGFTFPVSASSSIFLDPPTPSIMPSFSAGGLHETKDEPPATTSVPLYSFGSKKSSSPLRFSFPSTSNAAGRDNPSDLNFSFGSDKKARVSFSSVGKNAICY